MRVSWVDSKIVLISSHSCSCRLVHTCLLDKRIYMNSSFFLRLSSFCSLYGSRKELLLLRSMPTKKSSSLFKWPKIAEVRNTERLMTRRHVYQLLWRFQDYSTCRIMNWSTCEKEIDRFISNRPDFFSQFFDNRLGNDFYGCPTISPSVCSFLPTTADIEEKLINDTKENRFF